MAGKRNIKIKKGDDYAHVVTLNTRAGATITPIDITGRTYRAQLKEIASQVLPTASFVCVVTDAMAGEITISMPHSVTSVLVTGCYVWDLEQNASGIIDTILYGEAKVSLDVTR